MLGEHLFIIHIWVSKVWVRSRRQVASLPLWEWVLCEFGRDGLVHTFWKEVCSDRPPRKHGCVPRRVVGRFH